VAIYTEEVADFIWRNGEIVPWAEATIHVNAVGHASVAGIFEGIKAYWNEEQGELYVAEEIFFAGTGWEIMPVASVDRLPVGTGETGPITSSIAGAYRRVVDGRDDRHPEWRTPVWMERQ